MSESATEHVHAAAGHAAEAGHHAASGVKGFLGKQLGPMPMGGWLLAVAGGVAVAWYFRSRAGASSAASSTDTTGTTPPDGYYYDPTTGQYTDPNTGQTLDPGGYQPGVGGYFGGSGTSSGGGSTTPPVVNPTEHKSQAQLAKDAKTNAGWLRHAELAMIAWGFAPTLVQRTLQRYLEGKHLTPAEHAVLSGTLPRVGPPPKGPTHQHVGDGHHAGTAHHHAGDHKPPHFTADPHHPAPKPRPHPPVMHPGG